MNHNSNTHGLQEICTVFCFWKSSLCVSSLNSQIIHCQYKFFQHSEGLITSAEINNISYESLVDFHGYEAKKKFEMANWKKLSFSTLPILNIFLKKFQGLVLWWVWWIDAKDSDAALPLWLSCCLVKSKTGKRHKPVLDPESFVEKYWELAEFKLSFFESAILFFFASSPWKSTRLSYQISFISALVMVSSETSKRGGTKHLYWQCSWKSYEIAHTYLDKNDQKSLKKILLDWTLTLKKCRILWILVTWND